MAIGRPSGFTQDIADTICERIIDGKSLRSICADDDMPSTSMVTRWLASDEYAAFRAQYASAREAQADTMDDHILDTAKACTSETAAADRVKIDAFKWRAGKLKPKVYGDKTETVATVRHELVQITPDEGNL